MALFDAESLFKAMMKWIWHCQIHVLIWPPLWSVQWNSNQDITTLIEENAFHSVVRKRQSQSQICFFSMKTVILFCLHCVNNPLNTWRNNEVVITSKRRHFDVITSKWRRFDVITTSLLRDVLNVFYEWWLPFCSVFKVSTRVTSSHLLL